MQAEAWKISGHLYSLEENIPATPEMRVAIPRQLKESPITAIGEYPVCKVTHYDGTRCCSKTITGPYYASPAPSRSCA